MFADAALEALDFPRVRSALAQRAATGLGVERCLALRPSDDPERIARELDEVEDALFGVSLSLGGIFDIREVQARAAEGRVLSGSELLQVAYSLDGAMTVRRAIHANSRGALREVALGLGDHSELVSRYLSALTREGELRDDASPRLRDLRHRIEPLRGRIRDRLQASLERWADVLQENIVTLRRDRYVLPVQASRVGQVDGIIVDASATGQTYFVEPAAVTQLNNELTRLRLDEEAEVRRILTELSGLLARDAAVPMTLDTIAQLDLIAAKAALARDWRLNRAQPSPAGVYDLRAARHPLIEGAVANDLALGETRLLLITGPNMGGKTVTLKTLGLAVLMNQCGMYVAADHAELPVVRDVLVDIGDEQSIEASLSTFASHLKHLRDVLDEAGPGTLILVDELGSGTDPEEGAALSQAIIEGLLERDARGIITSHLAPLKLFALETPGLKNASMGFEVSTLSPTYRLQVGQPGRSYALAIAGRMGLPAGVLRRAEEVLGPEANLMERMLAGIEQERRELAAQLEAADAARRETEAALAKARRDRDELEQRRDELLAEAVQKADALYADAAENVRRMRRRAQDAEARPRVMQELQGLRHAAQKARPKPRVQEEVRGDPIQVGSDVTVPAYGASGQVLEMRGDQLVVQLGLMKVSVRRRDVRLKQPEKQRGGGPRFTGTVRKRAFDREIQLRGLGVAEAEEELRQAITEAHALKETPLRVVHGKGQGVLRRLLRDYLKTDKRVESYHDAEANQGGHGVTIVNVKV
ncbi:MutS2 protein [Deinococcus proteolyticus MRP]|uniref:Endonuclease MutS2 n=1 Tax=Deinococcus proteolyticus (strain ATCC 35074 / DSM 20540 / JCM 6276 / NBRC 101906 / NCIMB 13154 / VKM Ac-1939 / CCM 2703 / MRP) TaxID=693977 RepID=F0RNJ6_DEIPM|nr:Smr/MutS family protein [Deinococcus proteolyticus]ADY26322.1 MutS2 protein [Deinococcus proteolyticus MRP]